MAEGAKMIDYGDQEKTRKIPCIKRSIPRETLLERERESVAHFERQAEIARQRLRALEVAA